MMDRTGRQRTTSQGLSDDARTTEELRDAAEYAEAIVATVRDPLVVLDADLRIASANRSFYRLFSLNPGETTGKLIYEIGGHEWDIPRLRELLEETILKNTSFNDLEVDQEFANLGRRQMLLNARCIHDSGDETRGILLAIEDVTLRRRMEHDLAASELRYRRLFETAQDGILILDAQTGGIADVNPFLEQILGYSKNELMGRRLWEIGFFKDEAASRDAFLVLQEKGYVRYENLPLKTKGGRPVEVEFVSNIYKIDGEDVIQCNIRDITARRQAERSLEEEFAVLTALINSPDDVVIFSLDAGYRYTSFNEAHCREMRRVWNADISIGMNLLDIMTIPEACESAKRSIDRSLSGEAFTEMQLQPGLATYYELTWNPVRNKDGNVRGVACFVRDVSERKQAEEALRFSDAAFKSIHEAVFAMDDNTVVTHWNSVCERLFGIKASDAVGKPIRQSMFLVEQDPGQNEERLALMKAQGYNKEEQVYRTPNGDIWVDVHTQAIESEGRRTGWVTLALDIRDRKKAEADQARLAEKAQVNARLAAVGEMAAGVAHEINNPLTGVLGFSQLLLERQDVPEEVKGELRIIAEGSDRVADIVKRLLTFARQTKPVRTLVNLNDLIDNTLKLREYVLATSNIEVVTDLDPDLPWSVVDPGQLQQVFVNLIVNAEQAMKEAHGKGILSITTQEMGGRIVITIADDGPGISKENMGRVFEPFFTTKAPGEGTGLGLSLSRSIVLEHAGELKVESVPDRGTTFLIELPISQVQDEKTDRSFQPHIDGSSPPTIGRILVVDDEPGVTEFVRRALTRVGHTVDTKSNAADALQLLSAGYDYDVIISDVRMPGLGGMELYKRIVEAAPVMARRVIFITGDVQGSDVNEFLRDNDLPYLPKPFSIAELVGMVELVLEEVRSA